MNDTLWFAAGVVLGVPIGLMFRESADLIRQRDKELAAMRTWIRRNQTTALAIALALSMLINGVIGVAVMLNDNGRAELTRCLSDYNERVGKARDERTTAANKVARAEEIYVDADLRYQRGLLVALDSETSATALRQVVRERLIANEAYLRTLQAATKVRAENEYPPPNLCETS